LLSFLFLLGFAGDVSAQLDHLPYQLRYDRGQTVQPVFEGWSRNADGSFDMHFGYLNRNYVEKLHVPIGEENRFTPGDPDRGQPTLFHPRSNRNIFTVTVPADFGEQEIVWQVTTQGQTLSAVGWLDPQWEILEDAVGAGSEGPPPEPNDPPSLTLSGTDFSASLSSPLTMNVTVSDDGKPLASPEGQRRPIAGTQDQPPLLTPPEDALEIPVNVPQHRDLMTPPPPRGKATVSYRVWRGPADIVAEPFYAEANGGTATTTIRFSEPGEYQLQVFAHDGAASTEEFINVTVRE